MDEEVGIRPARKAMPGARDRFDSGMPHLEIRRRVFPSTGIQNLGDFYAADDLLQMGAGAPHNAQGNETIAPHSQKSFREFNFDLMIADELYSIACLLADLFQFF